MWQVFVIAGVLSAGVAALLADVMLRLGKQRIGFGLVIAVPLLALGLYLSLGRPELPGRAPGAADVAFIRGRNLDLLAQKPFEIVTKHDPGDIGALVALGDISTARGQAEEGLKFYAAALESAEMRQDPHFVPVAEKLGQAQVAANGGRVGARARRTFEMLRIRDPGNVVAQRFLRQGMK